MVNPLPAVNPDRFGELDVTVQAKVEPATEEVSVIEVVNPAQIVWFIGAVVTCGVGFTVTTTSEGVPTQLLAVGVA